MADYPFEYFDRVGLDVDVRGNDDAGYYYQIGYDRVNPIQYDLSRVGTLIGYYDTYDDAVEGARYAAESLIAQFGLELAPTLERVDAPAETPLVRDESSLTGPSI